jgi:6-phosphogluconolactonase (cycloisomerase 2 family)
MAVTGPAQIQFNLNGGALVVTEEATNLIDTYFVDQNGVASAPLVNPSAGETPFGFAISKDRHLIVSEAFGGAPDVGAVSSYSVNGSGQPNVVTPSTSTHQSAPCWIVITKSGKFTYTTATGSGTVSGFRINRASGQLTPAGCGRHHSRDRSGQHSNRRSPKRQQSLPLRIEFGDA